MRDCRATSSASITSFIVLFIEFLFGHLVLGSREYAFQGLQDLWSVLLIAFGVLSFLIQIVKHGTEGQLRCGTICWVPPLWRPVNVLEGIGGIFRSPSCIVALI